MYQSSNCWNKLFPFNVNRDAELPSSSDSAFACHWAGQYFSIIPLVIIVGYVQTRGSPLHRWEKYWFVWKHSTPKSLNPLFMAISGYTPFSDTLMLSIFGPPKPLCCLSSSQRRWESFVAAWESTETSPVRRAQILWKSAEVSEGWIVPNSGDLADLVHVLTYFCRHCDWDWVTEYLP